MPRVPPVTNATRAIPFSFSGVHPGGTSGGSITFLNGPTREPGRRMRSAFDAHGDAHAAADAQGREPLLGVAPAHLVEKRHEHPRAGCSDRVADRDGAAIDVHDRRIPGHV